MKPTGEDNAFSLPPALLAEVEAAADEDHRAVSDVVRDALERYLSQTHKLAQPVARRTPAEAAARMRQQRKNTFLPDGVTIRDLLSRPLALSQF